MTLMQLGLVDLIAAVQTLVEAKTGLRCYDAVPQNAESPFYFAEVVGKRPDNSKTMFRDVFTVYIHVIAPPDEFGSSKAVYELIQKLDEAFTEDITLPEDFWLIWQKNSGLQVIKKDETEEKHAVCSFEFCISYGFKTKI